MCKSVHVEYLAIACSDGVGLLGLALALRARADIEVCAVDEDAASVDLMVGEKKAISRGFFRCNGPCGCQDGHCAVRKSVIYIYSIYIYAPPPIGP